MKICDLHTHVLPDVDDGAWDMETALKMLKNAVCSDVRALALTPHTLLESEADMEQLSVHRAVFEELCAAARDLDIELYPGAEVHVTPFLFENAHALSLPTLNGGRYLLTEFPFYFPSRAHERVLERFLEVGIIPVVAHPERCEEVKDDPSLAAVWVEMGCHLQLTSGSVLGDFGRRVKNAADYLLERDLVCCVASDAHDLRYRNNFLMDVYDRLSVFRSPQYAHVLMWENPMRILHDQDL